MASIGGQAVLEGVMMRGPSSWAVAVRRPDGRISEIEHDVDSVALHRRWLRLPESRRGFNGFEFRFTALDDDDEELLVRPDDEVGFSVLLLLNMCEVFKN